MRLHFLYFFAGSLQPRFTTVEVHYCILQTLDKKNWNNWIKAGFSSDDTDYSMECSDGQWGLKSIICLASLRKSFLANAID